MAWVFFPKQSAYFLWPPTGVAYQILNSKPQIANFFFFSVVHPFQVSIGNSTEYEEISNESHSVVPGISSSRGIVCVGGWVWKRGGGTFTRTQGQETEAWLVGSALS